VEQVSALQEDSLALCARRLIWGSCLSFYSSGNRLRGRRRRGESPFRVILNALGPVLLLESTSASIMRESAADLGNGIQPSLWHTAPGREPKELCDLCALPAGESSGH
jgi:hypothetical protein